MKQIIRSRFDGRVLYECEADSLLLALQEAVKSGSYLSGADLSRSDLSGADLSGAELSGSDLSRSNLSGADLSGKPILRIIQCSGIGSEKRCTVAIVLADSIDIKCGCYRGTLPEFQAKIELTHANHPQYLAEYRAAVAWIQSCADACRGTNP